MQRRRLPQPPIPALSAEDEDWRRRVVGLVSDWSRFLPFEELRRLRVDEFADAREDRDRRSVRFRFEGKDISVALDTYLRTVQLVLSGVERWTPTSELSERHVFLAHDGAVIERDYLSGWVRDHPGVVLSAFLDDSVPRS